jgi:hypothetical protein
LVPGDMLRMIEEAANDDPVQMQNGFTAYDGCSGKSKRLSKRSAEKLYLFEFL